MTEANLTPLKRYGNSNFVEGPGTLDSDSDSDGKMLDYSDSDTASETVGGSRREQDRDTEGETQGEREREGDQGYLTASDGEEGEGDDEQNWTNGSSVIGKLAESDRNCKEHPSTWQGLSRPGPKRDGANDQSPQRARTVRAVVMKRKIRSASVAGRSVKDSEEDRDRDRDRAFFHIPQTALSSSGPHTHTHTHVPQSPGFTEKSHPTVDVRGEVRTDMRSVHSVRTPLRTSRHSRGSGVGVSVGVGSDMRGERGKGAENDDVRVRREGRVKKNIEKEYGMDPAKNGTILERESEDDREKGRERGRAGDLPEADWKGKWVDRAEGRSTDGGKQTDVSSPDAPQGKGSMWHTAGQRHSVKVIPTGTSHTYTHTLPAPLHLRD